MLPQSEATMGVQDMAVIRLVAHGATNRQISRELFISEASVTRLISAIMVKSSARNRANLVLRSIELGWFSVAVAAADIASSTFSG